MFPDKRLEKKVKQDTADMPRLMIKYKYIKVHH